ncbi:DUF2505 family protein [Stigmatella sp. ncwal1]|uniref:DUF2505 family protein n=1 Tax=Stigmatella ashevillensis TaxID=2995309 RepID=A0ABT5DGI7_9BACT|nr:DUF2505 family protein [Stigmatella ashevillena]MDC0711888.1 DUF2505 family protein [Stigmatella ashevillena]
MGKFTATHEIHCTEDAFWKLFFDKESDTRFHKEDLGYLEYQIVEQRETSTETFRNASAQPRMDLPGPLMKLFGSGYRHTEEGRFDKGTKLWSARRTPSTMADKFRQEYVLRVEPVGTDRVRRVIEYNIEAKVFGVGGLMESSFEKLVREEFDKSAAFLNKHLTA